MVLDFVPLISVVLQGPPLLLFSLPPSFSLHLYMVYASHPFPFSSFIALDQVPSARQLSHVHKLHNQPSLDDDPRTAVSAQPSTHQPITFQPADKTSLSLYGGGGLPPVPAKLAQRIQDGQFVEMVELLPEVLRGPIPYDDDQQKSSKSKYRELNGIVDWIQCFSLYIAIVCRSQPQWITDLLGYQNLIITSHMRFPDFSWATYDREFRQQAAATSVPEWSVLDNTLWNLARQSATRSTVQSSQTRSYEQNLMAPPTRLPSWKTPVCIEWNENLGAGCPRPFCRYEHICYRCVNVPGIPEKRHKAIYCPNKERRSYSSPASLNHQNKA